MRASQGLAYLVWAENSSRAGVALPTDERLWRSRWLRDCLVGPASLVACRVLEPFHDRHHGGVTTAGTARGKGGSRSLGTAGHLPGCPWRLRRPGCAGRPRRAGSPSSPRTPPPGLGVIVERAEPCMALVLMLGRLPGFQGVVFRVAVPGERTRALPRPLRGTPAARPGPETAGGTDASPPPSGWRRGGAPLSSEGAGPGTGFPPGGPEDVLPAPTAFTAAGGWPPGLGRRRRPAGACEGVGPAGAFRRTRKAFISVRGHGGKSRTHQNGRLGPCKGVGSADTCPQAGLSRSVGSGVCTRVVGPRVRQSRD